jgi:hypothetical protein
MLQNLTQSVALFALLHLLHRAFQLLIFYKLHFLGRYLEIGQMTLGYNVLKSRKGLWTIQSRVAWILKEALVWGRMMAISSLIFVGNWSANSEAIM